MSRPLIFNGDFEQGMKIWKMPIYIVDLWIVREHIGQQHLDLVIQDEKACDNKLMLVFGCDTTVSKIEISDFPPHQYNFKSISDFLNGSFKSCYLYDLIRVLHEIVNTQTHGANKKAPVNIICKMKLDPSLNWPYGRTTETKSGKLQISNARNGSRECYAITIGKTMRFKCSKFGWYYEVFPTFKKENKSSEEPFECCCVLTGLSPLTKYKIEIEVEYNKHVANVVLWDKDCIKFLKLAAQEFRNIMNKTGEDHHLVYPTHHDKLFEQELTFHIKYNPYFKQCSIVKLSNDDEVISTIKDYMNSNEV
ncbi:hypothetical protein RYX36_010110 [Vicia faba]